MKLFAWQPGGHGSMSWFVLAEDEAEARKAVDADIARRLALPAGDSERITEYECSGWGTGYYTLAVADRGCVLCNNND